MEVETGGDDLWKGRRRFSSGRGGSRFSPRETQSKECLGFQTDGHTRLAHGERWRSHDGPAAGLLRAYHGSDLDQSAM